MYVQGIKDMLAMSRAGTRVYSTCSYRVLRLSHITCSRILYTCIKAILYVTYGRIYITRTYEQGIKDIICHVQMSIHDMCVQDIRICYFKCRRLCSTCSHRVSMIYQVACRRIYSTSMYVQGCKDILCHMQTSARKFRESKICYVTCVRVYSTCTHRVSQICYTTRI